MKGFIEVTPLVFEPDYKSNNPFEGCDVPSKNKEIIALSAIKHVSMNCIVTNIQLYNQQGEKSEYVVRCVESYDQIKELIKQATV